MVTRSGDWHPEDIKAAIRKRGTTLTALSEDAGLCKSAVRNALIRPVKSAEAVIAKFLNVPAKELWPDRYDDQGQRIKGTRRRHSSRSHSGRHRQKREAA